MDATAAIQAAQDAHSVGMSWAHIVGYGITIGCSFAVVLGWLLKWSMGRNVAAVDSGMAEMKSDIKELGQKVDKLYQRQEVLQRESISRTDCSVCRRECQARIEADGKAMIDWMRRVEDKFDKLLMMVAKLNNGQGGVKNGLS